MKKKMEDQFNTNALSLSEKIKIEKQKRHQVYTALDYLGPHTNKFDFFSLDSIKLLKNANDLSYYFNQEKVTSDILLLSFLQGNLELLGILKKFNLNFPKLKRYVLYGNNVTKIQTSKFTSFFGLRQKKNIFEKIEYNYEVKNILKKAIENTYRFKTPVITPEILFLTILEDTNLCGGILLKKVLKNELNWNLLRYEILKKLHNQETKIQGDLPKSSRYFAYLLKIELDDNQFEKLLQKKEFIEIIQSYRDSVVAKVLEIDIFHSIEQEIKYSLKVNLTRKYSN